MIIRELVTRLGFKTDRSGLQQYESSIDNMKRRATAATNAIRGAVGLLGVALAGGVVKGLTDATDRLNVLESRLAALSQRSSFDQLAKQASASGVAVESYVDGYVRIASATDGVLKSQEEVTDVLETLNAGLKASGADAGTAAGVMRQFGQALGSGALRGDELNSLNEGAGVLMRELARAILGPAGTVGALKKLAEQGGLTTEVVLRGMRKIGPALKAQSDAATRTFGQAMQQLSDTVWLTLARFDQAAGITRGLTSAIDWLSGAISGGIDALGGINRVAEVFSTLAGVIAAARLPAMIAGVKSLGAALWALSAPLLPWIALVGAAWLIVDDFLSWVHGEDSVAQMLFGDFEQWKTSVIGWIDDVRSYLQPLIDSVQLVGKSIGQAVSGDYRGALGSYAGAVSGGFQWAGGAIVDAGRAAWEGLSSLVGGGQDVNVQNTVVINGAADRQAIEQVQQAAEQGVRGAMVRVGR